MQPIRRTSLSLPLLLALALLCAGAATIARPAQAAAAYACGAAMAPDQAAADAEVQRSYADWKARYVTAQGAGGFLRVRRPSDGDDTVSEGIGYGMLLAAYRGDRATFDGLWGYARSHRDGNGLMHWRIDAGNGVVGYNAATDADEDMALALIVADGAWGGYRADAGDLIGRIMQFEVEPGSNVLKPGDVWGGSQVTNPSYFAPAYYKAFARYTGDARWDQVVASSYQVIATLLKISPQLGQIGVPKAMGVRQTGQDCGLLVIDGVGFSGALPKRRYAGRPCGLQHYGSVFVKARRRAEAPACHA